jgi:hypothetical protein
MARKTSAYHHHNQLQFKEDESEDDSIATMGAAPPVEEFIQALKKKCGTPHGFDWEYLGADTGVCFNSAPTGVSFLHGLLSNNPGTVAATAFIQAS